MISLTNASKVPPAKATRNEQIQLLIINVIDDLEKIVRARELTNLMWDINVNSNKTEKDWAKTEILLESYEKQRDESLESALSTLKELIERVDEETLTISSSGDIVNNVEVAKVSAS